MFLSRKEARQGPKRIQPGDGYTRQGIRLLTATDTRGRGVGERNEKWNYLAEVGNHV
jgi:hypothetical protein